MAKVHCLYESEIRQPLANKHSAVRAPFSDSDDSDNSDDSSSSSSSSSEPAVDKKVGDNNRKAAAAKKNKSPATTKTNQQQTNRNNKSSKKKTTERKRPAVKPASKKQRQSMEVPVVDLAALVMPKRMASLNATAILAASSQQWPDSPKPARRGKPQLLLSSDSEEEEEEEQKPKKPRETKVIPHSSAATPLIANRQPGNKCKSPANKKKPALKIKKNISCVETAVSTSSNSQILRLSANIFQHQEVLDGQQTTTTQSSSTYHQSLSSGGENSGSSNVTSSSKTFQQSQVTTTNKGPRPSSTDSPGLQVSF
jgi:hypothetical protein